MVLPIGLQIRDLDNHWHLRLCRQENMMKGQRRRPAKKTRTGPGIRDGTVYGGKHNASLLEMPDRLPNCAEGSGDKVHPDLFASFILRAASALGIRDGEHQGPQPLPAQPRKDEIKVAKVDAHHHQAATGKFGTLDQLLGGRVRDDQAPGELRFLDVMIQVEDGTRRMAKCITDGLIQCLFFQRFPTRDPLVGAYGPDHWGISLAGELSGYKIGQGVTQPQREGTPQGG